MSAPEIRKGLENVYIYETKICLIEGDKGRLFYYGYPIEALVENSCYEEVTFLLWNSRLPKRDELEGFKEELKKNRDVPEEVIEIIRLLPKNTHPMDALRTAVSALSGFDEEAGKIDLEANYRMAIRVISKAPVLAAAFNRLRNGLEPIKPDPELSHAANFYYMLTGERPDPVVERAVDANFIIYAEHGMNASAFASLVTASALADMYGAITSGIATLRGPLHGGANEEAARMFLEIGSPERVEEHIKRKLERKEKIMGWGHRVYKAYDPRARLLKRMTEEYLDKVSEEKRVIYDIANKIEEILLEPLGSKKIFPNVDYWDGVLLYLLGIPLDFFTVLFALSRIAGWSAHILEYRPQNRIVRPRALYVGPSGLEYIPIDKR